jgi:hypothetical protein
VATIWHFLAHSLRQGLALLITPVAQFEVVEQPATLCIGRIAAHAFQAPEVRDQIEHAHLLVQTFFLGQITEAAFDARRIVRIEHAHRAAVGPQDADEHADGGGLARAILTEDAVDGAARNVERQSIDRDDVGERLADVVQRNCGLDHQWSCLAIPASCSGEASLWKRRFHSSYGIP